MGVNISNPAPTISCLFSLKATVKGYVVMRDMLSLGPSNGDSNCEYKTDEEKEVGKMNHRMLQMYVAGVSHNHKKERTITIQIERERENKIIV